MKYNTKLPTLPATSSYVAPTGYVYMLRDVDIITKECYWRAAGSNYTWITVDKGESADIGMTPNTIISCDVNRWEWIKPILPVQTAKVIIRTLYKDGFTKAMSYKTISGAKTALNYLMYNKSVKNVAIELL